MIDTYIKQEMTANHIPGLAAAIVRKDALVWTQGYGWADMEAQTPMTPDTIQNIGSVSKTFTATAVMQLWEQGQFQLDDDVNAYLPFAVRNPAYPQAPITFRQLLTHRSSIKDGPAYRASYACGDPRITLADWVRGYLTPDGVYYDPRENFHAWMPGEEGLVPDEPRPYTNVGFGLLGYLVEVIASVDFARYCQENIFEPLGMHETAWHIADINTAKHAVPYTYIAEDFELPKGWVLESFLPKYDAGNQPTAPGSYFPHCLYSFPNYPDGLVRTSIRQLARFLMAYANDGSMADAQVMRADTIRLMLSRAHFGRGLCWDTWESEDGDLIWGHGGADPGITTFMGFRPSDGVGAIAFCNRDEAGEAMRGIVARLYQEATTF